VLAYGNQGVHACGHVRHGAPQLSRRKLFLCCAGQESAPEADQQELFSLYQEAMESAFRQHLTSSGAGGLVKSDGPVVTLQELAQQLQEQGEGSCDEEVSWADRPECVASVIGRCQPALFMTL
jgi:hypothetical protein